MQRKDCRYLHRDPPESLVEYYLCLYKVKLHEAEKEQPSERLELNNSQSSHRPGRDEHCD